MRFLLTFIFTIFLFSGYAQNNISGIIIDSKTKESLPFATIIINKNYGSISDTEGKFSLHSKVIIKDITVSYIGYSPKTINYKEGKTFYKIALKPSSSLLNEVVLIDKRENPALAIIRQTIANKDKNNPDKVLESYKYNSYNKFLVTANPDSIRGTIDSVWTKANGELIFKKIDSSNYEMKKTLDRSHLYLTEKISKYKYKKGQGKQEEVLASRMAGFKEPIYEFLAMNLQSLSFYDEFYTVMGSKYLNPIANNRVFKEYDYKILDTLQSDFGRTFMIYFKPKTKGETVGLEGLLYINETKFAVEKAIVELKAVVRITATMKFEYLREEEIWFPNGVDLLMRKGDNKESLMFAGSKIQFQANTTPDSLRKTVKQNDDFHASDYIYLSSKNKSFDIVINPELKIRNASIAVVVDDNAHDKSEEFWNKYRTDSITTRGLETYVVIDSIIEEEGVEQKLNLVRSLFTGYYPTKYFDINLNRIIDYNNYEGLRVGFGGRTSANISSKFNIEGYGAYGFNDYAIKGSIGANVRLDKMTNTWIGASYTYDVNPSAKTTFITDEQRFMIESLEHVNNDFFNSYTSSKFYIQYNFLPNLKTKLLFDKTYTTPEYGYAFENNGIEDTFFDLSIFTFGMQWEPYSKFIQTRHGRKRMHDGYPKLTGQYTQSVKDLLDGEYNFQKVDLRLEEKFDTYGWGTTDFLLIGGIAFGDTPLSYLYGSNPNSYLREPWIRRVNLSGTHSFETMLYREFFSDKYVEFHFRHTFDNFDISDGFKPQLSIVSRLAYGSLENKDVHKNIDFKTLEDGYFESGVELNKLFRGLGIGTYYRYGPNMNTKWDDNLFVKISFRLDFFN